MDGLMQDLPLTVNWILARAERYFGGTTVATNTANGIDRRNLGDVADEARRIAAALDELGISEQGRVATFAWNSARHLALYFAIPGTGRVMHTANIRYFPDQLVYTINHAEDEAIFVDRTLLPLLAKNLDSLESVRHVVVMDDGGDAELPDDPRVVRYDEVVATSRPLDFADRVRDENRGAAICYTTGTTGNPKGVFYSHRSMWLHANTALTTSAFALRQTDCILPVVPMFHANAWGLPYAACLAGASLVMPGPDLSGPTLLRLMQDEHVTVAAGVPTIWMGMVPMLGDYDLGALRMIVCGGSAVPKSLSEAWRAAVGIPITQAWGMTETSPIATVWVERSELADKSEDEKADLRTGVGLPGESAGLVPPIHQWSGSSFANLPIGQGLSMTLLQMAGMYQAMANDGVRIPPRILKATIAPDGTRTEEERPEGVRVVSPETARTVRNMFRAIVQRDPMGEQQGTGPAAAVEGYQIAGKTGTAQQINPACGCYYSDVYWITFAGMATVDDPRYVIGIMMDAPHRAADGSPGSSAAPLFHNIASWLLQRQNVPLSPPGAPLTLQAT